MRKLSLNQKKLLLLVKKGYKFVVGANDKGYTIDTIINYNSCLYATLTLRSLIRQGLVEVTHKGLELTETGVGIALLIERFEGDGIISGIGE